MAAVTRVAEGGINLLGTHGAHVVFFIPPQWPSFTAEVIYIDVFLLRVGKYMSTANWETLTM